MAFFFFKKKRLLMRGTNPSQMGNLHGMSGSESFFSLYTHLNISAFRGRCPSKEFRKLLFRMGEVKGGHSERPKNGRNFL